MKSRMVVLPLLAAGLYLARTSSSALIAPAPRRLAIPEARTACGKYVPLRIEVRALATPVLGQDLVLQFSAQNRGMSGPFDCRLRFDESKLTPLDEPLEWVRELPEGQVVTWQARVRVNFAGPIALTAKVRSLAPVYQALPAVEGYAVLYPFDGSTGQLRPTWDEASLRPLSQVALPTLTLPNNDKAVVLGSGICTFTVNP